MAAPAIQAGSAGPRHREFTLEAWPTTRFLMPESVAAGSLPSSGIPPSSTYVASATMTTASAFRSRVLLSEQA